MKNRLAAGFIHPKFYIKLLCPNKLAGYLLRRNANVIWGGYNGVIFWVALGPLGRIESRNGLVAL